MSNYIKHLDCYLPKNRLYFKDHLDYFENGNYSQLFENGTKFLEFNKKTLDLESVIVETEKKMEEMAVELLDKNLDEGNIIPEEIDYVFIAVDWDFQLENFGHYMQHEFDMKNAKIIRVSGNYCTNVDMAMDLACGILDGSDKEQNILIITGSKFHNTLDKRIIGTYGVMGDSIGLMLLSNNIKNSLLEIKKQNVVTKGELHKLDLMKDNAILHFQSYIECLDRILENEVMTIDKIILHNANQLLLEQVFIYKGINKDSIDKTNQNKYGHLGTTDLILNLKTYAENGAKKDDNILSLNLGVVGTYVATLFQKT
jgi:3-oxoacyl-[acyl-carrier-protein] synthase III